LTLYFEDFEINQKFSSEERCITQEDIQRFAELSGDFNKLHLDEEYAKQTLFGGRIAHGLLILSVASGLWYKLNLTRDSIVAFIGIEDLSFKAPVYPGNCVHLVSEVASKRESKSRGDVGLVFFKDKLLNERGNVVLEFKRVLMLLRRKQSVATERI
jgi:acyl dehydratase